QVTSTGCSTTKEVTVSGVPAGITGSSSVCLGSTTTLSAGPIGGVWSSSNAAIASVDESGVVTGNYAATAIITYTASGSCIQTKVITVTPPPGAIGGVATMCEG